VKGRRRNEKAKKREKDIENKYIILIWKKKMTWN